MLLALTCPSSQSMRSVLEEPDDVVALLPAVLVSGGCFILATGVAVKWVSEDVVDVLV